MTSKLLIGAGLLAGTALAVSWLSGKSVIELISNTPDKESLDQEFKAFMEGRSLEKHPDVTWTLLDEDDALESEFEEWLLHGQVGNKSTQDWVAKEKLDRFGNVVAVKGSKEKNGYQRWNERADFSKWRTDHQEFLSQANWVSEYTHAFRVVGGSKDALSGAQKEGVFGGFWQDDDAQKGGLDPKTGYWKAGIGVRELVTRDKEKLAWAKYMLDKGLFNTQGNIPRDKKIRTAANKAYAAPKKWYEFWK
jgi:hypothetical protein